MRGKKVVEKEKEQLKMYVVVQKQYIASEEKYKGIAEVHVVTDDLEVAKAITARMRGDYYTVQVPFVTEPMQWEKWPLREDVIRKTALAKLTDKEKEVLGIAIAQETACYISGCQCEGKQHLQPPFTR